MWTLHSHDRKVPVGCSNSIRVSRKLAEEHKIMSVSDMMTNFAYAIRQLWVQQLCQRLEMSSERQQRQ